MRVGTLILGGWPIFAYVPESPHEQERGLRDFSPPDDDEGMYFFRGPVRMADLAYPIDVIVLDWPRAGRVNSWVTLIPGDRGEVGAPASHILELRAGWMRAHRVGIGNAFYWVNMMI